VTFLNTRSAACTSIPVGISNEDIRSAYHIELWWGSLMKSIYFEEQEGNQR
jgi:hypothetical protein